MLQIISIAIHIGTDRRASFTEFSLTFTRSEPTRIEYGNTGDLVGDAKLIIDSAQCGARQAVNVALVVRSWLLGGRIAEEELGNATRSETSGDIAPYSVLNGSEQLFANKRRLHLPTEGKLRAEIEAQKEMFSLQHGDDA